MWLKYRAKIITSISIIIMELSIKQYKFVINSLNNLAKSLFKPFINHLNSIKSKSKTKTQNQKEIIQHNDINNLLVYLILK